VTFTEFLKSTFGAAVRKSQAADSGPLPKRSDPGEGEFEASSAELAETFRESVSLKEGVGLPGQADWRSHELRA